MSKYQDKLNEFGQEVLKAIESGKAPWQKPWKEGELLEIPKNATTDNGYRGINLINLALSGYNDPRWLTFVQAKKMDCKVRKGEKSRVGFYYSPSRLEKELENGKPVLDAAGKEKMVAVDKPVFRTFALFNATQVEGVEPYKQPEPSWKPEEKAERLLSAAGITIVDSQLDQAFYRPSTHTIETPPKAQFRNKSKYYSTVFHELGHATGHPSMLNRDKDTKSKDGRAKEELRAEISAWLVCTQIGIGYTPQEQDNNKNYVAGWLSALKDKDRAKELGFAMKDAEKIADHILALDKDKDQVLTDQQSIDREPEKNHFLGQKTGVVQGNQATEKTYIKVPFSEKDEAKTLGAKWDKQKKSWFVEPGTDQKPFQKWLKPVQENRLDMNKVTAQFRDQAFRFGLKIDTPLADGKLHRVAVEGDKGGKISGAYTLYPDGRPAGFIQNHKTGEKANFKYDGEIGKTVIISGNKQARAAERNGDHAAAAKTAFGIYTNAQKTTDHPYLADKKINGDGEYRVDKNNRLIIPAKNIKTNKIESLQFIGEDGQKQFLPGGKKSGNAYTIGELDEQKPILLTEGFATGKTLNDISHLPAVVCFDANNLENVAKQIRELMPSAELFICADNDHAKKNNVGVEKAKEAAKAVGAKVIIPKFTDEAKQLGYTDFNDLTKCKMGKSRIKNQLEFQIKYLSKNKGIGFER